MIRIVVILGSLAALGCRGEAPPSNNADSALVHAEIPAAAAVTEPTTIQEALCDPPPHGVVISRDSVGGLATRAVLGELVQACPASTVDVYSVGGYKPPARVFHFAGAELSAVQTRAGNSLDYRAPADLWAAEGDSVRLPDGFLLPRTVGELRKRYPADVVTADQGDDADGTRVASCRFPGLQFILPYHTPTPAPVGRWPISSKPVADSTPVTSVEILVGTAHFEGCSNAPAT